MQAYLLVDCLADLHGEFFVQYRCFGLGKQRQELLPVEGDLVETGQTTEILGRVEQAAIEF